MTQPLHAYVALEQDEDDDRWWVTGVLLASGRGTARIAPLATTTAAEVVAEFVALGCPAVATDHGLVTGDLPADVDVAALAELLEAGSASGRWQFDIGVEPG